MNIQNNLINFLQYKKKIIIFLLIILLASVLRIYKLNEVPPSLSWDEAAVGYNAWTIANWGRDEYGKLFPAYFKSFADDKHPVHIYATALSVKLLGLSEFSTRFPAVLFGVLNVALIYFLAELIFSSKATGLIASFFLAISPYNIHFSRFNHEANFALFFFMLGLFFFFKTVKRNYKYLPLSALSFGITFLTYHPAKIIVPFIGVLLGLLYWKQLLKNKVDLFISLFIGAIFLLVIFFNQELLGFARAQQTSLSKDEIRKTQFYELTHNELLGRANLILIQYSWLVSPKYLFISGDKNPRLSDQHSGQFYKIDAIFLVLGMIYLILKRSKAGLVLIAWALIAPLPSALVGEAPHGARAMFMMGSWNLIAAAGLCLIINLVKKPIIKIVVLSIVLLILTSFLFEYLNYYYNKYPLNNPTDWQYGMKEIVGYIKEHQEYSQIYTTDARSQPYIFFLYYLKPPLGDYLNSVIYNNSESNKSYNTVSMFDKYYFGGWEPIESFPNKDVLYALTPSQYDGLRFKLAFKVKKIIYYPDNTTAYYLVSAD